MGPKVELKNLNSISAIRRAIHFEIARQTEDYDRSIPQIQSTRRWDDDRGETQLMRTKEDAHDYRYFTCPDLLPIRTAPLLEKVRPLVSELPHQLAARFENDFGVTTYDAEVLSSDRHLASSSERRRHARCSPSHAAPTSPRPRRRRLRAPRKRQWSPRRSNWSGSC